MTKGADMYFRLVAHAICIYHIEVLLSGDWSHELLAI